MRNFVKHPYRKVSGCVTSAVECQYITVYVTRSIMYQPLSSHITWIQLVMHTECTEWCILKYPITAQTVRIESVFHKAGACT
jgi:hypothetical protein